MVLGTKLPYFEVSVRHGDINVAVSLYVSRVI